MLLICQFIKLMRISTLSSKNIFFAFTFLAFFVSLTSSFAQCPTVTNTSQSFCDVQSPKVSDLVATNIAGGGIKWYLVSTGGTALNPTLPLNTGSYFVDNNAGSCVSRIKVDVVIYSKPSQIDLPGSQFCVESTVANLKQTLNGNPLNWYLDVSGGSPLPSTWPLSNNTNYYASQVISASSCETTRRKVLVTVTTLNPPTGDAVQLICSSPSPKVSDFIVNTVPNATVSWYYASGVSISDPSNTVIQEGAVYKVTQSNGSCESSEFAVSAQFEKPNDAGSNGSKSICISDLPTTIPFNLFDLLGGNPDKTGVWTGDLPTTNGYLGKIDIATQNLIKDYTFEYQVSSSSKCLPATSTVTVTVLPLPTVSISTKSPNICSGKLALIDFAGTPLAVVKYKDYNGDIKTILLNPDGEARLEVSQNGKYELVSVASSGVPSCTNVASGNVVINVLPLPTVSVNSASICPGDTQIIKATPSISGNYSFDWTVPAGVILPGNVDSFPTTIAGDYSVIITDLATTCASTSAKGKVTINPLPLVTVNSPIICSGESTTIKATPSIAGTYSYSWTVPAGVPLPGNVDSFPTTIAGDYSVKITDLSTSCASTIARGTVTIKLLPIVAVNSPIICQGESTTIKAIPSIAGTYSYAWTVPAGVTLPGNVDSFPTTIAGEYSVKITDLSTSCASTIAKGTVTIKPLPTVTVNSPIICEGESTTIKATPSIAGTYSYAWTVPAGVPLPGNVDSFPTTIAGDYSVKITDLATTCASTSAKGKVTINPSPTVTISTKTPVVCSGTPARVDFEGTPLATVVYTANGVSKTIQLDANGEASLDVTQNTVYKLVSITSNSTPSCIKQLSDSVPISVTINSIPTVTISSSGSVCSGSSAAITFKGTPNSIVTYTVNGGDNQTVNIGSSGIEILNTTLAENSKFSLKSINFTNSPSCLQTLSDEIFINVAPRPIAGNNTKKEFCSNEAPQNLFLLLGPNAQSGGTWTSPNLTPSTGFFDPKVDPIGSYVYTVAGISPCANESAIVEVTIKSAPNAGTDNLDAKLCSNSEPIDLITLLGGTPQTGGSWTAPNLTPSTGIFDPSVDLAGKYTYIVKGGGSCNDAEASVVISILEGPNAGKSGSTTFCKGSAPKDLFLSLGGKPQVGGKWSPPLDSGTGFFNPEKDKEGVYTYSFSGNQPCSNDAATVTVILKDSPDAGENNTANICSNEVGKDLFTFLKGSPQAGGTWTSPNLTPSTGFFDPKLDSDGEYTYTVGNPFCTPDTAKILVKIIPGPDAGLPGVVTFCANSLPQNLFLSLKGTPQTGGSWTSPNLTSSTGIFDPKLDLPGVYTYRFVGNQPCDDDTATVTVTIDPIAKAGTFSGVQNICNSTGTFNLFTLLTANQTGGVWTDSNNNVVSNLVDVSKLIPNTYSYKYTVTSTCGTDDETVQFVIVNNPVLTSKNIVVSSPKCKGNNVTVTLTNMENGNFIIDYKLTGSNELQNQKATVTIVNGTGNFDINASNIPNIGVTTVALLNITNVTTTCTTVIFPNVSANFILLPSSNIEDKDLVINDVCLGSAIVVSISGATTELADGNYQFNYKIPNSNPSTGTTGIVAIAGGAGQFTIPASHFIDSGSYDLTITSITSLSSGCNNLNENATKQFQIFPVPNVSGASLNASSACLNYSNIVSILDANSLNDGIYTIKYQLSGASTLSSSASVTFTNGKGIFTIPANELNNFGNVTITISEFVSQVSSCPASGTTISPVTFAVTQLDTPTLNEKGNEFCGNTNPKPTLADLTENITGSEPLTVVWYDAAIGGNILNSSDLLENGKSYFATLKSASSCESATRLEVIVDLTKCNEILIPDGFSPNTDGVNDEFVIKNIESTYPNYQLEIYNRYGNILYKGNINTPNWDGTTNQGGLKLGDSVVPVGVYFYILEFNDGIQKPKQGRLYLSR